MNKRIRSLLLCFVMVFMMVAVAAPALAASEEPALISSEDTAEPAGDEIEGEPVEDEVTDELVNEDAAADFVGNGDSIDITPLDPDVDITPNQPASFSIPFTKTVKLGGDVEPDETEFALEIIDVQGCALDLADSNASYSATVSTDGTGEYNASLVLTGTGASALLDQGFLVRENNGGDSRWDYDDTVYFVTRDDSGFRFFEAITTDNGYAPANTDPLPAMVFVNTYTENVTSFVVPFTKTVKLGGDVESGEQSFELEILGFVDENGEPNYLGVSYTATVTTNGAGDYDGKLVITGPESEVEGKIACEEFFVREKNTGAENWTYSDAVWCVKGGDDGIAFYPAELNENGGYSCVEDAAAVGTMVFENTYTENKPAPTATPAPTKAPTKSYSPKTGDESAPALWLALLLANTAVVCVVIGARRKSSR